MVVFGAQSDKGDLQGGVNDISLCKRQLQGHILFEVVVDWLQSEEHQCECLVVCQGWF